MGAAYWDWKQGMRFMESMYKDVLQKTLTPCNSNWAKFNVDMSAEVGSLGLPSSYS